MAATETQHVTLRSGATEEVGPLLDSLAVQRVLLVLDEAAYENSGAAEILEPVWQGRRVERFVGFEVNPKIEDIERGIELMRRFEPQAVVAVGGGTALDLAKIISTCGVHAEEARSFVVGALPLRSDGPPLLVVPTTAGTGSEATHFAVAYVAGQKYSLAHEFLLPDYVFLDPQLTASLPAGITRASGLDALCQAVESIWSVGATEESIAYASEALQLAVAHLQAAVLAPTPEARLGMVKAAHLAGKAINISKTTAAHAVSYPLTTHYHVPHGAAVALTLSAFLGFNSQVNDATCCDPRGAQHVRDRIDGVLEILGAADVAAGQRRLSALFQAIGCPVRISEVGVPKERLAEIVEQVNSERLANNPRTISPQELGDLLASVH